MRTPAALIALALLAGPAAAAADARPVAKPRHVRTIATGETGWFSSPAVADLDGDGDNEIVAPAYSTLVLDARGRVLGKGTATSGRVYAPAVVADLDGDGRKEVVAGGNDGTVAAYELTPAGLRVKSGWPASTCSGGQCPEARGMAAADLDGDGRVEVAVTTTNTAPTGAQVFVFDAGGHRYRPPGGSASAWPRYNTADDATFNGAGNHGYGAYGENVAIGQLDGDPQLELVVTFDNHQINVFNHDGTSVLASPWFTNRQSEHAGRRLGWGQFIRWLSPRVERDHYHRHRGDWPDVRTTPWLQWTASPPAIADLDRDGRNEVIGLPNVERKEPYETQAYAFMVLDGAYGSGARSARRHKGFRRLPLTRKPAVRPDGDFYPPSGIPAPTLVDLRGDRRPEIVAAIPDGAVYAVGPTGRRLWRRDYARGAPETFASEVGGRRPEPRRPARARLRRLRSRRTRGAPRGAVRVRAPPVRPPPAAPGRGRERHRRRRGAHVADLDGDRRLEIVLSTFDHGLDVYRVPRSRPNALPWPTGRGNLLRNGAAG